MLETYSIMSATATLTESFFASILRPATVPSHLPNKDAGIYLHELHPHAALRATLKKSSTSPNCLAVSSTHVFAAQAEKAVVHVYNLERNAQECIVPLPEKVTALALVGGRGRASNGVLAMGLEGGRIALWEVSRSFAFPCSPVICILSAWEVVKNTKHDMTQQYASLQHSFFFFAVLLVSSEPVSCIYSITP